MYIFAFYTLVTMKERALGYIDVNLGFRSLFLCAIVRQPIDWWKWRPSLQQDSFEYWGWDEFEIGSFHSSKKWHICFLLFYSEKKRLQFFCFGCFPPWNGIRIGSFFASVGLVALPKVQQSTLKLKKGDSIDLQKGKSGGLSDCPMGYCHHFSGWMLEEDLEL